MKYIIILGIQNSGSGAVHDYLASRNDCEAPFGPNEFRLCADPMGLHNLYLNYFIKIIVFKVLQMQILIFNNIQKTTKSYCIFEQRY